MGNSNDETFNEQRRKLRRREATARRRINQTADQIEKRKRQYRESKARISVRNMTTTTDKLPHVLQENIAVSHSSENTDLLINVNVHINTVSIPKARLYPFNSNGLQRHNLGRMDRSCPFCGALKWVDESRGDSLSIRLCFSTCCARGNVILPHLQEPLALLKAYITKNDAQSREFRQKSMSGLPPHKL